MPDTVTVFSPVRGTVVPLEKVPDPVFSERMLGDGLAVNPSDGTVCAPIDGKILDFHAASHALALGGSGIELLLHVGLETVRLNGNGFTPLVKTGDTVKKGQPLLKVDLKVLAKYKLCPLVLLVVTNPPEVSLPHRAQGAISPKDPLFDVALSPAVQAQAEAEHFIQSPGITVQNANGLHARPAGVLVQMALKYPFAVQLVKGDVSVNAKSVVSIMGLALVKGDRISVRAAGPEAQAKAFLAQMQQAFADGFGETDAAAPRLAAQTALIAAAGLAFGPAFLYQTEEITFPETADNPLTEKKHLNDALQAVILETEAKIVSEKNEETKAILQAHISILRDPDLTQNARRAIESGRSAAYGINEALLSSMRVLQRTGSTFLAERTADLEDLRRLLLRHLGGTSAPAPAVPEGSIVIARELLPSEIASLEGRAAGVLLAEGSPSAHASILLRNLGIPTVVRAGQAVLQIPAGTPLCLDAENALFLQNPTPEQKAQFEARLEANRQERLLWAQNAQEAACTLDGVPVRVEGNVSNEKEAAAAIQNGADGLGLVRTEFLFCGRQDAPSQAQQQTAYQAVLDAAQGKPVTLRLLDAGGDKPLPFVHIAPENNPIVGVRGIRAFPHNEEFFRTQLRALLSVRHVGGLRLMLPMVTFTEEVDFFRQLIAQEKAALNNSADVKVGIMVEVPSAALISGQMAARADFFSIGTNDLTQYTLAIDRGHKELNAQADPLHPAVLKLIELTCQGAKKHAKPVAVCGAMAGDLAAIPFLIGLGVTELAVGAGNVAQIKALVRGLDAQQCAKAARQALELNNAREVRALAKKIFGLS